MGMGSLPTVGKDYRFPPCSSDAPVDAGVRGMLVHHASRGNVYLAPEPTSYVFLQTEILDAPMVLMSILAAIGTFPMQRIYKCTACKFATAETVKTP